MDIMVFGQLKDITGCAVVSIEKVSDTTLLLKKMYARYPLLKDKKFLIAVNQKIISEQTEIGELATIALLPPFSGG